MLSSIKTNYPRIGYIALVDLGNLSSFSYSSYFGAELVRVLSELEHYFVMAKFPVF